MNHLFVDGGDFSLSYRMFDITTHTFHIYYHFLLYKHATCFQCLEEKHVVEKR